MKEWITCPKCKGKEPISTGMYGQQMACSTCNGHGSVPLKNAIFIIRELYRTSAHCPTQFSGKTTDDAEVYIRFRWGRLSIDIDGESVYNNKVSDGLDGIIDIQKIKELTSDQVKIVWPDEVKDKWPD